MAITTYVTLVLFRWPRLVLEGTNKPVASHFAGGVQILSNLDLIIILSGEYAVIQMCSKIVTQKQTLYLTPTVKDYFSKSPRRAIHCLAQKRIASIMHFRIPLFLAIFSVRTLSR